MAFDITLCFVTPHAGRVTGFLTAAPMENTRDEMLYARDQVQKSLTNMEYLTIFTRDESLVLPGTNPTALEITLPAEVLRHSVMIAQVIEVPAVQE